MRLELLIALCLAALVGACGGLYSPKYIVRQAPADDPGKSQALQIAQASGIGKGLRDVPKAELDRFRGPYGDTSIPSAYLAAGTVSELIPPAPGLSYGAASMLSLVNFFDTRHVPARDNRILAWVPQSEVEHRGAAYPPSIGFSEFLEALRRALPKGFVIEDGKPAHYVVRSPSGTDALELFVYSEGRPSILKVHETSGKVSYVLEGGQTLTFTKLDPTPFGGQAALFTLFRQVSATAPAWLYLYLAPGRGLSGLPVILHRGQILYFEQPGTDTEDAHRPPG
jgi:hypothetical protein